MTPALYAQFYTSENVPAQCTCGSWKMFSALPPAFFFSFSDSESIWIVIKNSSVFRLIHLFHIWKLFMCRFWCVLVMQCFQTVLQTKMCCAWVLIYDAWSLGWLFAGSCFSLLILLLFSIIQVIMECLFGSLTSEMDERINSDAPCHFFRGEYFCSDSQQVIVFFLDVSVAKESVWKLMLSCTGGCFGSSYPRWFP